MSNKQPKDNIGVGKGRGRPKGALNKTTQSVKAAIEHAAEGLGGADRLVMWAKEDPKNESAFWTSVYPKLLPLQVTGEGGGPVEHKVTHGMDFDAESLLNKIRGTS